MGHPHFHYFEPSPPPSNRWVCFVLIGFFLLLLAFVLAFAYGGFP